MPAAVRGQKRTGARTTMSAEAILPGVPRGASKLAAARQAGLPAGAASAAVLLSAMLIAVATLATGGRGEFLWRQTHAAARTDLATLGFRANIVHLQGASPAAQKEVLAAAAIKPGAPILDIDLAAMRARVEQVGWVSKATVLRLLPDTLVIAVKQRPLMAVWQHDGRSVVVADNGAPTTEVDPARFGGLPLIVGAGANLAAAAILPEVLGRPRLARRLTALVRVDDRRWNLQLNDGGVILLPAVGEASALGRLDGLDRAARILDLGLARIDLRDPEMVVVRPRGGATPALSGGGI